MRWWKPISLLGIMVLFLSACSGSAPQTKDDTPPVAETQKTEQPAVQETSTETAKPSLDPAQELLDKAIAAHGGLDSLKKVTSWTNKSKGVYMGMPYTSSNAFSLQGFRMDIDMPDGQIMSMVMGLDQCWSKTGLVVVPCTAADQKTYATNYRIEQAVLLWPLKTDPKWSIELVEENLLQATYDGTLSTTLWFDPETSLLEGYRYSSELQGKKGVYETQLLNYSDHCGIKMWTAYKTTFEGQPFLNEEVTAVDCGVADVALFNQPDQVADGHIVENKTTPATVACLTHKGPYDQLGQAIGALMTGIQTENLPPMGAPIMVYRKAPPRVKNPKRWVTDVCMPVGAPPPAKAEKKGAMTLAAWKVTDVLSLYGIGDYSKNSGKWVKNLLNEAKKRKLKVTGPVRQISYMDPTKYPPEQWVSELQVPVRVKGKKKK